jgi:predicted ArsR family transcriptional regulator
MQEKIMTKALDAYLVNPDLSFLDKVKIQAQVLVPVMRALRAELGKAKADAIVGKALRDWSQEAFAAIGGGIDGSGRRRWSAMQGHMNEISGPSVEFETQRKDQEAFEFDVTRCRFAEFFRELNEPELGALLACATDFDIAATSDGAVKLEREQTIMQGAPSCTFRYKFAPR